MRAMAANKLDPEIIKDPGEPKRSPRKKKKRPVPPGMEGTRIGKAVKKGERLPPKVPKNKSLAEIDAMDEDDPEFKHPQGEPRSTGAVTPDDIRSGKVTPRTAMQADKQKRANARRARARKGEAKVTKAVEVLHAQPHGRTNKKQNSKGIYDEDAVYAEGILSMDDWDDEELIRGYRRNRSGRFGPAPKFIPKEVQQELFRRIVARGDRKMRNAYLVSIDVLTDLAENAGSDKVRLDAIRELMNRVVGKVPDKVHIAQEQPYEQFLADAVIPVGDEWEPEPMGEAVDLPALSSGDRPPPSGEDYGGKAPVDG